MADNNTPFADWFNQIPGLVLLMNTKSEFVLANQFATNLFGYKNDESFRGQNAYQIPCPAAASANDFINQDQYVIANEKEITLLDIHVYADNAPRILITKKKPYYQNNELTGLICHCTEVYSDTLSKVCSTLIQSDERYVSNGSNLERSYVVGAATRNPKLSQREMDVLFYYLRGKTSKTIAKIIGISNRTVEHYIENVKDKLLLDKKEDIIEYCIVHGYFSYIPDTVISQNITINL